MAEEQTGAVEAAPEQPQSLDVTDVAALIFKSDNEAEKKPEEEAKAEAPAEPAPPEQAVAEEAPQESETAQEEPAREAEAEPEAYDLDKIHGNTRIRLRDGSEWTAGELKRRIAEVQGVEQAREQFAKELESFGAARAQVAQQAQAFAQLAPQAIAAIQQSLPQVPPLPPQTLAQTDPFAYSEQLGKHMEAKQAFDSKVAQIRQLQAAAYQENVRQQQERAQALQSAVNTERTKLLEKFPEFADSEKAGKFQSDYLKVGKDYGFSDNELRQVYDHRMIAVMRDAIAYRNLQSNKPKPVPPAPAKQAAPVQPAGKRATASEADAASRQSLVQRARQSGDMRDIAAVIAKLNI